MCNSDIRYKHTTVHLPSFLEKGNILKVEKKKINLSTLRTSFKILTGKYCTNTLPAPVTEHMQPSKDLGARPAHVPTATLASLPA